jgi:hypothetical protein
MSNCRCSSHSSDAHNAAKQVEAALEHVGLEGSSPRRGAASRRNSANWTPRTRMLWIIYLNSLDDHDDDVHHVYAAMK